MKTNTHTLVKVACAFVLSGTLVITPNAFAETSADSSATTSQPAALASTVDPAAAETPAAAAAAEDTAASTSEAPAYATLIFKWMNKEVFREDIQNGKQVTIYSDEAKTKRVSGTPLTVDTTTLSEDFKNLIQFDQFFQAGKTLVWEHEVTPEGNLVIWPTYTDADPNQPGTTVPDNGKYKFNFKWLQSNDNGATTKDLPWFVRSEIPTSMKAQFNSTASAADVKTWLQYYRSDTDLTKILVDETNTFASEAQRGLYEYVALKEGDAKGTPQSQAQGYFNTGYYKFTPLCEYRKQQLEKATADLETANAATKAAEDALKDAQDQLKAAQDEIAALKEQLAATEKERDDALAENEALTNENTSLKDQNTALTNENTDLKDQNTALTDENADLKDQNAALSDENAALTDENTKLSDENADLTKANEDLTAKNTELTDANKALTDENAQLKDELAKLKAQGTNTNQATGAQQSNNAGDTTPAADQSKGASLIPQTGDALPFFALGIGVIAAMSAGVIAFIARRRQSDTK